MSVHDTQFGQFSVTEYRAVGLGHQKQGIVMRMEFKSNALPGSGEFGFVQVVTAKRENQADLNQNWQVFDTVAERKYGQIYLSGWVDSSMKACPIFKVAKKGAGPVAGFPTRAQTEGDDKNQLGCWSAAKREPALLYDFPKRDCDRDFFHRFETVVVVTTGPKAGQCLGSLGWGYAGGPGQAVRLDALDCRSEPSAWWRGVVQQGWNSQAGVIKVPLT